MDDIEEVNGVVNEGEEEDDEDDVVTVESLKKCDISPYSYDSFLSDVYKVVRKRIGKK